MDTARCFIKGQFKTSVTALLGVEDSYSGRNVVKG